MTGRYEMTKRRHGGGGGSLAGGRMGGSHLGVGVGGHSTPTWQIEEGLPPLL